MRGGRRCAGKPWVIVLTALLCASFASVSHAQQNSNQGRNTGQPGYSQGISQGSGHAGGQFIPNNMIVTNAKTQGSSSKQLKEQAIRSIPLQQLSREHQTLVSDVLNRVAVYRRLPSTTINTDPDLFLFMVRYPETMLNIWQIMGVTQMEATRTAPFNLDFDDGVGTEGRVELIYGTPNMNIYYGEGIYEGPMLFRRVEGQCVLVLQTEYHRDANGNSQTTSHLDVFIRIDHLAAGVIARTVHPLIGSTADHNFVESLLFLQKLSETSESNNNGVMGLSNRLNGIRPEVRQRFQDVLGIIGERTQQPQTRHSSNSMQRYPAQPVYKNRQP